MGFTRTHLIGVFVTEIFLGTIAVGFAMAGFFQGYESGTPYLLVAVCLFLAQISVLLSSILSLLFYMGPGIERGPDSSPAFKGS
jgi:hypothetical protein